MRVDITEWTRRSEALRTDDIDLRAFAERRLAEPVLRCLRYMHDVEFHTVCYLRDLLLTPAHTDPEITAFLTMWNYEEFWHAEAIASVLVAHGESAGHDRVRSLRLGRRMRDAVQPLAHWALGRVLGNDMVALHMSWGAVNEWTTQAAYGRLAARADHPELTKLMRRIMRQEGRHIEVYASTASMLLHASSRARQITRFALRKAWKPVGTGVAPDSEVHHLAMYLFDGAEGGAAVERIDRSVDRLPGLHGLRLLASAMEEHRALAGRRLAA